MGGYFWRILDSPTWGHAKCRLVRFMGQRGHMGVSLKMYGLTGYVCDHRQKWRLPGFRASLSPAGCRFRRVLVDASFSPRFRALLRGFFSVPRFGLV